ncbi:MAG TPA: twin-arginine translocation signal domain-containing protein [Actinomycetota bacterium]|nr:twin-arginine translocation signal domain-containing protein [Actinomycetota bacterium]
MGRIERAGTELARRVSRRSFLGKLGRAVVALAGGPMVAVALAPERAEAHHICGHIFTTGSCPHPYAPNSRIDRWGFPVHPTHGYPVDDNGYLYLYPGRQTRRKVCQVVVSERYPFVRNPRFGGGWSRCCGGRIRHISDCCSRSTIRINGDGAVRGYCPSGLRVFCIAYRELNVRC